jgi:hypothetical protein
MNDLRKYIDLISNSETLSERRGPRRNKNKNKNKPKPNKKPPAPTPPKPPAPTPPKPPKSKREAIKNLIKNNPRIAKALGIVAGLSAIPFVSNKLRQEPPNGPNQDGMDTDQQDQQQIPSQNEIAVLKAKIDAMIKELEPSTDPTVKKELERIKQKLLGVTTNRRTGALHPNYPSTTGSDWDYYQRARNFLDRVPNQ